MRIRLEQPAGSKVVSSICLVFKDSVANPRQLRRRGCPRGRLEDRCPLDEPRDLSAKLGRRTTGRRRGPRITIGR